MAHQLRFVNRKFVLCETFFANLKKTVAYRTLLCYHRCRKRREIIVMALEDMAWKIKKLRQERDMTLEQVAKAVGVGKSTVRKWETGMIANMRRDKIAALAKALGTSPAYLMGWDEEDADEPHDKIDDTLSIPEGMTRVAVYGRDGKATYADFTPDQVKLIESMIAAQNQDQK